MRHLIQIFIKEILKRLAIDTKDKDCINRDLNAHIREAALDKALKQFGGLVYGTGVR